MADFQKMHYVLCNGKTENMVNAVMEEERVFDFSTAEISEQLNFSDKLELVNHAKRQFIYALVDKVHDTATLDRLYLAVSQTLSKTQEIIE